MQTVRFPKLSQAAKRVLGIDLGIASCGWALIDLENDDTDSGPVGRIVALGTWMFDAPETDKERTPTNQIRRTMRGQRRVIRRRRQRMNALRRLFLEHKLLPTADRDALKIPRLDPWKLRAEALDRVLGAEELAVTLAHIARHRGFKSNKKSDGANAADESSKMLKEIEASREKSAAYRTVGEMLVKDPTFAGRLRNRDGDYTRSLLRQDLEAETRKICEAQRRLGNPLAGEALQSSFAEIAFFQRPLQDSKSLLGPCQFEKDEKRTSKRAPSFELFRYLSRLTALRLRQGRTDRPLTLDEIGAAAANFGRTAKITFKALRKLIDLDPDCRFVGVSAEDEKHDVAARKGEAAFGTAKLRDVLGDAGWSSLVKTPERLDRLAEVLTFRDAPERIRAGLDELALDPLIAKAVMDAVAAGAFARFTGAGHISSKAARAIVPFLKQGRVYSDACAQAGYDHAARPRIELTDIGSPVARKALSEAVKQINAVVREYGVPDAIHIELARDVGKSKDQRDEIKSGIDKRNAEKDRLRTQYEEDIGHAPRTAEDLLRYELWKQQNCRCIYTDAYIGPKAVASTANEAQVDHILPWSRFGDDSFHNKALVTAKANQDKRGQTPFEWFSKMKSEGEWDAFVARVEGSKVFRGFKKRNLLLKNAAEVEERFRSRNLNDTRYASRALAGLLEHEQRYPPEPDRRRVFARPGTITSKLRQAWGVQDLKKDADGKRLSDDRHHALDALVCAATTEGVLNRLTRAFQEAERRGLGREIADMPQPWQGFRDQAKAAVQSVFVARAERRRARGKAHDATIKQLGDDGSIYERKPVEKLTLKDLELVKNPERNGKLIENLRAWIEAGKPKNTFPLSPKGDPVRKVRVLNRAKDGVPIRGGIVDRGEMVRVDVFRKKHAKGAWQYFLVPVYPHQVAMDDAPPRKWVQAHVPESEWKSLDAGHDYLWPLHPMSLIELVKSDGVVLRGYYRGMDRSSGTISLSLHHSKDAVVRGTGTRTLSNLTKLTVDRLGRVNVVEREKRTWHGVVCT
jgi:CRISPR-associated endonuclease Csn1